MSTIEEVYRELNFPSKRKLALALHARRIPFTGEELEELTRTSAVRQIFAPPPKYEGKITSARVNEKWQADLANMTSKPGGKGEDHILFVMDIFTRRVWARAIKGSTAVTVANAFALANSAFALAPIFTLVSKCMLLLAYQGHQASPPR